MILAKRLRLNLSVFALRGEMDYIWRKLKTRSMRLEVVIEKDETGYYVAEVPALPGCFSQGKTLAEVTRNIKEAIEGWLEVMNDKSKVKKVKNAWGKRIAINV